MMCVCVCNSESAGRKRNSRALTREDFAQGGGKIFKAVVVEIRYVRDAGRAGARATGPRGARGDSGILWWVLREDGDGWGM